MDLIIKPTKKCNFCCKFCSSSKIDSNGNSLLTLESIYDIIRKNNINTIIVNGGDPLMVDPQYYFNLINFLNQNSPNTTLSFTTNLWDFYINPNKWIDLFKNPRLRITTSFQYGNQRIIKNNYLTKNEDNNIFDEDKFLKVIELFNNKIGYIPNFISVITNDNDDKVLDTVLLAKKIGNTCKINPAIQSGRNKYYYPIYKAYEKYLDIIDAGLKQYEYNSSILKDVLENKNQTCPYCRDCWKYIRAISPDNLIHSCGFFNDDHNDNIKLNKKTYELSHYNEKEILLDHKYLKTECLQCPMYQLCNSCFKYMDEIKYSNQIDTHCHEMQKLWKRFVKI